MKTALRILAFILLLFLGFGGIYGAFILISDPSGSKFDWSLDLLNGTPFSSYLLPGIVLLIANGIFPLCVAVSILLKKKYAHRLILLQGAVVFVWLTAQLLFNPEFFLPVTHYPTYGTGLILGIIGLLLKKQESTLILKL
jgi:hypothetical protein